MIKFVFLPFSVQNNVFPILVHIGLKHRVILNIRHRLTTPCATLRKRIYLYKSQKLPFRLRKAGRMWCGGARGTHRATCHNEMTPRKSKEFLKSPCFSDLNGRKTDSIEKDKNRGIVYAA